MNKIYRALDMLFDKSEDLGFFRSKIIYYILFKHDRTRH